MLPGWTILFFIYEEDAETAKHAAELIETLSITNNSEALTLVVFESVYHDKDVDTIDGELYELRYEPGGTYRKKFSMGNFPNMNPGNVSVLSDVLGIIKDKNMLREKFLLFTWDHGLGFGIFDGDPVADAPPLGVGDDFESMPDPVFRVTRNCTRRGQAMANAMREDLFTDDIGFESAPSEEGKASIDMLTNREINAALKTLGRKTDLVIMMNCWMQMLETSYELAENVNYLVAAETVHFFAGYDYKTIINEMVANPSISAEEVAKLTVDTTQNRFQTPVFAKHLEEIIISTVDLSKLQKVDEAMTNICGDVSRLLGSRFSNVTATRGLCLDLTDGYLKNSSKQPAFLYFIDFKNYILSLVTEQIISSPVAEEFKKAIDEYIIHTFIGKRYEQINPRTNLPIAHGLSIFHPSVSNDFNDRYYSYFYEKKGTLMADKPWGDYLRAYQKGLANGHELVAAEEVDHTAHVQNEAGFALRIRVQIVV